MRESFLRQVFMRTFGAELSRVPARSRSFVSFRRDVTQQHGYLDAAVVTAIVDNTCGYAAMSVAGRAASVVTVEYEVNFLAFAVGDRICASARVLRRGHSVTVTSTRMAAALSATSRPCSRRLRRKAGTEMEQL